MQPDLVWRCRGEMAEIAEGDDIAAGRFRREDAGALESLRDLISRSRMEAPAGLPPMTAGVFGAIGYDMVRLVERLPHVNPDPLGLPDGIMTRPSIVAIFDAIGQEIILTTVVRPSGLTAKQAYAAASARLNAVITRLAEPLDPGSRPSPVTRRRARLRRSHGCSEAYGDLVERAKRYIEAGDVFQVVPSHRFSADFDKAPLALYRSLRRTNPSPFMYFLNFGDFQLGGVQPGNPGAAARRPRSPSRPIAGTPARAARRAGGGRASAGGRATRLDPKEARRTPDAAGSGPQRCRPGGHAERRGRPRLLARRTPSRACTRVTDSFFVERYSHVMPCSVSNVEGDAPEWPGPGGRADGRLYTAATLSGAPKRAGDADHRRAGERQARHDLRRRGGAISAPTARWTPASSCAPPW